MVKEKTTGKIKFSEFMGCYMVIYYDPEVKKNTVVKKNTRKEAEDFLLEQGNTGIERRFWYGEE